MKTSGRILLFVGHIVCVILFTFYIINNVANYQVKFSADIIFLNENYTTNPHPVGVFTLLRYWAFTEGNVIVTSSADYQAETNTYGASLFFDKTGGGPKCQSNRDAPITGRTQRYCITIRLIGAQRYQVTESMETIYPPPDYKLHEGGTQPNKSADTREKAQYVLTISPGRCQIDIILARISVLSKSRQESPYIDAMQWKNLSDCRIMR